MKKIIIIGVAALLATTTITNAQNVATNTAVLAAQCQVVRAEIQATFYTVAPSPYQPGGTMAALNTNNIAKIPAVVSAMTGGKVTIASDASPTIMANALAATLSAVSNPPRRYADLTNSLAQLNAGWAAAQ